MLKFTSAEWQELIKEYIVVYDPDGWDRTPEGWDKSWNQEQLTFDEFMQRVVSSTCKFRFDKYKNVIELLEFLNKEYGTVGQPAESTGLNPVQ